MTNRLSSYAKDGALKASYSYNASGQRVEKTLHGTGADADGTRTTNFAYTPDGWLLSEIGRKDGGARTFTDEYIWLGGRPLAKLSRKIKANGETAKADILYLHTDHLATPRRATNADGTTVWSWESDAFGASKADRDPDGDGVKTKLRLRFPGQYYDDESGLHYNHHRDYDPKLGRYIQSDPIGLWGGDNRYGYVSGNPMNLIDPMGLAQTEVCQSTTYVGMTSSGGYYDTPNGPVREGQRRTGGTSTTCYLNPLEGRGELTHNQLTGAESNIGNSDYSENGVDGGYTQYADADTNYCSARDPDIGFGNRSPRGNLVDVSAGNINIYPRSMTVPNISIPNTVGATGFSTRNLNDHVYNVWTNVRGMGLTPENVGAAFAINPTPGQDSRATPDGTRNNVGRISILPNAFENGNWVRSFTLTSPDSSQYTDITVNYTIAGQHVLHEGYVIRYGVIENGMVVALRSYGEGHGAAQDPLLQFAWCRDVGQTWDDNHQEIINSSN